MRCSIKPATFPIHILTTRWTGWPFSLLLSLSANCKRCRVRCGVNDVCHVTAKNVGNKIDAVGRSLLAKFKPAVLVHGAFAEHFAQVHARRKTEWLLDTAVIHAFQRTSSVVSDPASGQCPVRPVQCDSYTLISIPFTISIDLGPRSRQYICKPRAFRLGVLRGT